MKTFLETTSIIGMVILATITAASIVVAASRLGGTVRALPQTTPSVAAADPAPAPAATPAPTSLTPQQGQFCTQFAELAAVGVDLRDQGFTIEIPLEMGVNTIPAFTTTFKWLRDSTEQSLRYAYAHPRLSKAELRQRDLAHCRTTLLTQ